MTTFLFKTEPEEFAFDDLAREKRATWDGVTNNAALKNLRSARPGDTVFIYHTGDERAIVGLAQVTKPAYQDPKNPGVTAKGEPKFAVVDIKPLRKLPRPVTLAQIKADPRFAKFPLVTQGRLSVMPVPDVLAETINKLAGL